MPDLTERAAVVAYLRAKAQEASWAATRQPDETPRRALHLRASWLRLLAVDISDGRHMPGVPETREGDGPDAVTLPLDVKPV